MRTHEHKQTNEYLADPELAPPRILLADDDADMRALISEDLRDAGFGVVECVDGAALLQRLDSSGPAPGLGVDLVVADIFMPGLTGLEVLERLRGADPFTPYIVITAFGSSQTRLDAARLGAIAVLDKPFETKDLLRLIDDTIGTPSPLLR